MFVEGSGFETFSGVRVKAGKGVTPVHECFLIALQTHSGVLLKTFSAMMAILFYPRRMYAVGHRQKFQVELRMHEVNLLLIQRKQTLSYHCESVWNLDKFQPSITNINHAFQSRSQRLPPSTCRFVEGSAFADD